MNLLDLSIKLFGNVDGCMIGEERKGDIKNFKSKSPFSNLRANRKLKICFWKKQVLNGHWPDEQNDGHSCAWWRLF